MITSPTSGMAIKVRRLYTAMGCPKSSRYCLGMLACRAVITMVKPRHCQQAATGEHCGQAD